MGIHTHTHKIHIMVPFHSVDVHGTVIIDNTYIRTYVLIHTSTSDVVGHMEHVTVVLCVIPAVMRRGIYIYAYTEYTYRARNSSLPSAIFHVIAKVPFGGLYK